MYEKRFKAALDQLHDMLAFIKSFCENNHQEDTTINKILLAAEEALVNVIHHGYPQNEPGVLEIDCEVIKQDRLGIKICIRDQGIPFDPMEKVKKIKKTQQNPVEDPSIGGYGIYLYIEIMDNVEYHRKNGVNVLSLIKYLD